MYISVSLVTSYATLSVPNVFFSETLLKFYDNILDCASMHLSNRRSAYQSIHYHRVLQISSDTRQLLRYLPQLVEYSKLYAQKRRSVHNATRRLNS